MRKMLMIHMDRLTHQQHHHHPVDARHWVTDSNTDDARSIKSASISGMLPLASDFKPGPYDVICARGKAAKNHVGNIQYRLNVERTLEQYSAASTKLEKSQIVSGIVDSIRESSRYGGFVKEEDGRWFEVGDHIAREKVGQR